MKPPRTPWHSFPDVLIHASESSVKQHSDYHAAKSGDGLAAIRLVRDTINPALIQSLALLVAGHQPILVSAHAYERQGVNAIPEILIIRVSGPKKNF